MVNSNDRVDQVATACAKSAREHERLCPRQVLGVRMGYAAVDALHLGDGAGAGKRLLIVTETDGCFVDGISAATGCTIGHRTLRLVDYGRVALTAIDTLRGTAIRVAPRRGAREAAWCYASEAPHRYGAQLAGYQSMPIDELLTVQPVTLSLDLEALLGNGAARVDCAGCGEEILNGRGELTESGTLCPGCRTEAYYATVRTTSWTQ
jgi:formylmethanofuran dehydrogenase subunit E